jgi:hypothetical protein
MASSSFRIQNQTVHEDLHTVLFHELQERLPRHLVAACVLALLLLLEYQTLIISQQLWLLVKVGFPD